MSVYIFFQHLGSHLYFAPIIIQNAMCRKHTLLPLYEKKANTCAASNRNDTEKTIIYMVLKETVFSGGLSDRLRGICSIYEECIKQNIDFKIYFKTPNLSDYLQPNKYDWRIDDQDIDYDTQSTYPCSIMTYHSVTNKLAAWAQKVMLKHFMAKPYSQIHIYSNMVSGDRHFSTLFNELFKPSSILQEQIDYHLNKLGGMRNYIAMTYRFRSLIGDFVEGGYTLPESERAAYLDRCKATVVAMHEKYPDKRILVTSDSQTFLSTLSDLEYVYVIPGKVVHISHTFDADTTTYLKSFTDYYMLSFASHIWLVRDRLMYHSGFPYRASLLNDAVYGETKLL